MCFQIRLSSYKFYVFGIIIIVHSRPKEKKKKKKRLSKLGEY
jgi:hypothetical protein